MEQGESVFWKLGHLHRAFFEVVRSQSDAVHLHPKQGPIIGTLLCHDGLSQADLVRELNVSAATVAVSISRLEKLDMLKRVRDKDNRRAYILTLTEKGRMEGERMQQSMCSAEQIALQGFTLEEKRRLEGYCQRMLHNLQGDTMDGEEGTNQK